MSKDPIQNPKPNPKSKIQNQELPPGVTLRRSLHGHEGPISQIAWSPDRRTLASASNDQTIRLWDAATGKLLQTLTGHSYSVYSVAWSPNGP
ncbi:MAG: hypothetical protein GY847_02140 [Proteobacteria bacterium]|nr:hypothetical protein [Pseudomonadota bacterium]